MRIQKVQNNYNNFGKQIDTKKQNILNNSNISFQSSKQQLFAISVDSFKSECAKKLYLKIQKYFQLLGEIGSMKEVKLMHEKKRVYSPKLSSIIDIDTDICLSINKSDKNSNIKLYHKYPDPKKKDNLIFNVTLDKNGQMFKGEFLPKKMIFEREGKNIRRMYSNFKRENYLPVGNNDKEWSCIGSTEPSYKDLINESEKGAFEIFIELARLKTSII